MLCLPHSKCVGRSLAAGPWVPREGPHCHRGARIGKVAAVMASREPRVVPSVIKDTDPSELPVTFTLQRPVQPGQRVGVLGSVPELSNWDEKSISVFLKRVQVDEHDIPLADLRQKELWEDLWVGSRDLPVGQEVQLKFVLVDENGHITWVNDLEGVGDKNLEVKVEEGVILETKGVVIEVCPQLYFGWRAIDEEAKEEAKEEKKGEGKGEA